VVDDHGIFEQHPIRPHVRHWLHVVQVGTVEGLEGRRQRNETRRRVIQILEPVRIHSAALGNEREALRDREQRLAMSWHAGNQRDLRHYPAPALPSIRLLASFVAPAERIMTMALSAWM